MFAPFWLFALFAAERSVAIPFPQATEPPLLSDTDIGASSPITPASNSTAPTAMINRRVVTIGLLPRLAFFHDWLFHKCQ